MIEGILYVFYIVSAAILVVASVRLARAFRRFRMKELLTSASVIEDMPSVSVCIPARNESHAMTDALHRVLASTYPKLEILVLDDFSVDKTPSLIKAFAQDGVRFVEATTLPDGWLGKNHALSQLASQASGTYILYMDVDTQLQPDSIEQLVAYAKQESAAMVSLLPRREDGLRLSTIFSPLRYLWELLFDSRLRPATSSSAWLIERATLLGDGPSFESLKQAVQPEAKIAAALAARDAYEKKWRSQVDTSVRLLYRLVGGTAGKALLAIVGLLVVVMPLFIFMSGFFIGWNIHHALSGLLWSGFAALYAVYLHKVWRRGWIVAALLWDVIVLQEIVLLIKSALQYTRGTVTWKGRTIRLPKD